MDTHGMKFVVDTTGVAKGFRDYRSAVEGIFASLDKFESHVDKTMKGVAKAAANPQALSSFKKAVSAFSKVDIDPTAAKKLSALSAAMSGFKAPSASQAANTRQFFKALGGSLPDLSSAYKSIRAIDSLKGAMAGFKAPPASASTNLTKFANAMRAAGPAFASFKGIAGVSGIANELATMSIAMRNFKAPSAGAVTNLGNFGLALQHLGRVNVGETGQMIHALAGINNFKAPSAANIRNLLAFAQALHQIKPIPNATAIAEQMSVIANAASRASFALGGFRNGLNGYRNALGGFNPVYGRFNSGTNQAKVEMMGLQNAFSTTFQVGSLLRSLLGSLTVAELGRAFFQATQTMNQFEAAMQVIGESPMMSKGAWDRIRGDANHFGADLNAMSEDFSKFSLAAHENGVSLQESFKIFEGFNTVMTATHMATEQKQSVGLAIREMMDQGYVSTQRLTRQLGLVLPGATHTLMEAWKATGSKLNLWDALKKKLVDSTWALDVLSNHYKTEFGPGVVQALKSPIQQWNILKNNIMELMVQVSDSGPKKAFADLIAQISGYMDPGKVHTFAQSLGIALTGAVNKVSEALKFMHDHWDDVIVPIAHVIKLIGEWEIAMGGLQIGKWMVSPLMGMARVLPILQSVGAYINVMAASSLPAAAAGAAKLTGAQRTAAISALQLRNATVGVVAGLGEETVASNGLSASLLRLSTAAGAKAASGVRSLIGLVGGPYVATFAAATYAVYELYNAQKSAGEAIASTTSFLKDSKQVVEEATSKIYLHSTALGVATARGIDFNDCTYNGAAVMDAYKIHMDKVTGGLYSQADAARTATIETLKLQAAQNQGQLANLQTHSTKALGSLASKQFGQGHYGEGVLTEIYRGAQGISSHLPFGTSQQDIDSQIGKVQANGTNIQQQLKDAQNSSVMDIVKKMQAAGLAAPDKTDAIFHGSEGGGKKKKHRQKDPYTEVNKVENAIDDLMKKLTGDDPIGILFDKFTTNIRKEAEDLLSIGGFKTFFAQVKKGGGDAVAQTQALIGVLQSGKGLNDKNIADLKARYGKTIPDIIQMLKQQLQDLQDDAVEAAAKTIEATYKGIIKARKMIGEFNPATKANDAMVQQMQPMAEQFMNQADFEKWYEPLIKGNATAAEGFQTLRTEMLAAINPSNAMHERFLQLGISGDRLKDVLDGIGQGYAYEQAKQQESLDFGAKLLRQKSEEIAMMGLSNDQAEVMKDLQQEVNERLAAHQTVTQQDITALKQQLTAQQQLERQMERNKSFFENNGVRSYINDLKDVGSAVNDLDKNFLQSLEDQLYNLGTTGKFSFKAIFDTIQQGLVRFASQGLVKTLTEKLFSAGDLESGTPSIFGKLFGKMGFKYQAAQKGPLGSTLGTAQNPMFVQMVGINPLTGNLTFGGTGGLGASGGALKLGDTPGLNLGSNGLNTSNSNAFAGMFGGSGSSAMSPDSVAKAASTSPAVIGATTATAKGFQQTLGQFMPLIGMAFAGTFKSPIAQVGAMFASMLLQKMLMGSGGGGAGGGMAGGIGGLLGKLFGGGGGGGGLVSSVSSMMASNPGIFMEGGYSTSPVATMSIHPAAFINAPHYAQGTANTSGGQPAILHPNEAVIPLSRGRKVPVEIAGGGGGQTIVQNYNISTPDANSFRKSKQQMAVDMHMMAGRAFRRNN